jgi:hypothetical protein
VEWGPGCLVSMPVFGAAQKVKVSEMWPKMKFFDFHKMFNNLLEGQKKVPRATKIHFLGQFVWICFRYRQRDEDLLVTAGQKLHKIWYYLLIIFTTTI